MAEDNGPIRWQTIDRADSDEVLEVSLGLPGELRLQIDGPDITGAWLDLDTVGVRKLRLILQRFEKEGHL